jgi:hypothetical protein
MRQTARRFGGTVLAALLLAGASGCVHESVRGDTVTYTYEWWLAGAAALGAVVAAAVGWCLMGLGGSSSWSWFFGIKRTGFGLLIGGPVVAFVLLPTAFTHYAKVDDYHFEVRHGWWWSPTSHTIRFDQLKEIGFSAEERRTRHGRSTIIYLDCISHAGQREEVDMDVLMQQAVADILKRAEQRGVKVVQLEDPDDRDGAPPDEDK